ncbi:tyrosine-type recombinase/integrase [Allosaccharopolyspora coralli]|uniref:Tyrosine-type recombinase/integrase n=1 Tax=Allosaccharopolyspora coralli TaxID=2665642 RepID=A0A5Q3Q7J6_9PSEU|nr:tyrosine-type recombinase/integrase [Allosaccharopolyspora coralli]QGK70323.1 tyrosine-type recombinase/integrase [Allosaccharopolyspora coralli]
MSISAIATAPRDPGAGVGGGPVEELRRLLRPEFLARVGWDAEVGVVAPARDDALLGLRECVVIDCQAATRAKWAELCTSCWERHKASGIALEAFTRTPSGKASRGEKPCRVAGCPRPTRVRERLCGTHSWHRKQHLDLTVQAWLARPEVVPLPSYGDCRVPACIRRADDQAGLCKPHVKQWRKARRGDPDADLAAWVRSAVPVSLGHVIVLKGLPDRVQLELLLGIQRRTDASLRTLPTTIRHLVKLAHARRAGSVFDLAEVRSTDIRHDAGAVLRSILAELYCALSDPERERAKDIWHLVVFGLTGTLDFTGISQPWLRAATKHWVAEDLPLHRGRQAATTSRDTINAVTRLSESLRLSRDDYGTDATRLGRGDVVTFTNRMVYLRRTGQMSEKKQLETLRRVRRFLDDLRALGLTRPPHPAAGLAGECTVRRGDVPREAEREARGRDLPPAASTVITENLGLLEARAGLDERRITELLIDTGRRPDEACALAWDCLERDHDGKPTLIYTDSKNDRPGRRLPISEATAALLVTQQSDVRARFPHTPVGELALFPRVKGNKDGTKPIPVSSYTNAHRVFVDTIEHLLIGPDGQPLDSTTVVPYSYRHTYAQRHADEGVNPDVLRELLGHRSTRTTTGYYRVTEKRVRAAVDRVSAHQVDGHGRQVFGQVSSLLAHEHARLRVGQVAVPFGICTEPSNVKAGGKACPYKFTCLGCGHFRSDPSYLPELKSYLQQLLADHERVQAATDIEDWARARLSPAEEEISTLRTLIRRIETDLDTLTERDRAQITEAINVIRTTRQTVSLGMPSVRPPAAETGRAHHDRTPHS